MTDTQKEKLMQDVYAKYTDPKAKGGALASSDKLPYTQDFEKLYSEFIIGLGEPLPMREVWEYIVYLRKRGRLLKRQNKPKVKKRSSTVQRELN